MPHFYLMNVDIDQGFYKVKNVELLEIHLKFSIIMKSILLLFAYCAIFVSWS